MEPEQPDSRFGEDTADLLRSAADYAIDYLHTLPTRRVHPLVRPSDLAPIFGTELPDEGADAEEIVETLVAAGERGVVATAGPRYFGFVIGGALPAAVAADWLATAWDQNGLSYALSPAASVIEEIAASWLLELFDLPRDASVGFTTGCQMANFTGLAAGRRSVLLKHGWDVEQDGLQGAPRVRVIVGGDAHITATVALQMLGFGSNTLERVATDDQGRMRPDELRRVLDAGDQQQPLIVAAQAGNVNSGAFDPIGTIAGIVHERDGWLHVDGAFGLWARTSPALRALVEGLEAADSWASDMHKWLNVPYDSGLVIVRDSDAHRVPMTITAAYLAAAATGERDPQWYVPESSRRARGFAVYAALRSLGRNGVADLVGRCCALAARFADRLAREPGIAVLNEVVLNQVLVRFGDDDELTRDVIRRVQEDGTCWMGGTTWHGVAAMRISVSNWSTTEGDVDMSADAIVRCYRAAQAARSAAQAARSAAQAARS